MRPFSCLCAVILNAFAFFLLWNWFVADFTKHITIFQASGIVVLIQLIQHKYSDNTFTEECSEEKIADSVIYSVSSIILGALFYYGSQL